MLQPVLMADTAHKEVEEGLGRLQQEASIWENLANSEKDQKAYSMYKSYSDNLRNEINNCIVWINSYK